MALKTTENWKKFLIFFFLFLTINRLKKYSLKCVFFFISVDVKYFLFKKNYLVKVFCNWITPNINASAVGGHPGTYMSTGIILSQPLTTEYE